MKRLKLALVLGISVLALTGCGAKGAEDQSSARQEPAAKAEMMQDDMKESENNKMGSDKMEKEMSDDKMMDGKKDHKMDHDKDDKMSKSEMKDTKMSENKMDDKKSNDQKSGDMMKNDIKEDKMSGTKKDDKMMMEDGKKSNDKMKDDKMKSGMNDKTSDNKPEDKNAMKDDKMSSKKMDKKNEGEMAMDFSLKDKDGNEFTLSQRTGKKVYVKFWASWCSICLAGLEELDTLAGEQNDFEIVTVVAPGVRGEKSKEDFIKWFDTLGYNNIRVLFDEEGKVMGDYGVRAFPSSAMIGTDGVLVGSAPGHLSNDLVKEFFDKIK
ncbi:MAG: redoxin family protein [Peptostreptococcaceae bacterium]|nr:redoxin family protein [Peptostreptococcaceae bacterium]